MDLFLDMYRDYFNIEGKTDRKSFWMTILFYIIATVVLQMTGIILGAKISGALVSIFGLVSCIPIFTLQIRRLNDTGRTWKSLLFHLIPAVGTFIVLYFLVQESK